MDAAWRRGLGAVLAPEALRWLESEVAREAAEALDPPLWALFDDGEDEDPAGAVARQLEDEPSLRLRLEDVPQHFRSPAWFRILRPGSLPVPLALGASRRGHGDVVWAAAELCAEVLATGRAEELAGPLRGRRVLELGAGVGLPACVALRRGAHVVASDMPDAQRLLALATSLALNLRVTAAGALDGDGESPGSGAGTARVVAHSWGDSCDELGRFDLILCCDCLYVPALHGPLLRTLAGCLAESGLVLLMFSLHGTAPDAEVLGFLEAARAAGLAAEPLEERQLPPRCGNLAPRRSYVYAFALRWAAGLG